MEQTILYVNCAILPVQTVLEMQITAQAALICYFMLIMP